MKSADVEYIVIHCSDSPQGRGDTAATIHQWHLENDGWAGIGYHRVILEDGRIENGRPLYWAGSHAYGYNRKSIGICLIGDGLFTTKQYEALYDLIIRMKARFKNAKLVGHYNLDDRKTCPNFDVRNWFDVYSGSDITQEEIDLLLNG